MEIPEFPQMREVTLEDKPPLDHFFGKRQPEVSAYTFTNIFAWREPHETGLSRFGDAVIVHYNHHETRLCLEPLADDPAGIIRDVLSKFGSQVEFVRVSASTAHGLKGDDGLRLEHDRDNADYLYLADDLIRLEGRKYDAKRNFINRFKINGGYEYVTLDQHTALECHEFAQAWCEERVCETSEGLKRELCAIWEMLTNFEALGLCGGAIRMDGAIVAFTLGERLNDETLVCHVEKADSRIDGLYQLINNEFAIHEGARFRYINREQDLGIPGLRKAKESYHPVRLVEAYRVSTK
jgi:hypothetical protein